MTLVGPQLYWAYCQKIFTGPLHIRARPINFSRLLQQPEPLSSIQRRRAAGKMLSRLFRRLLPAHNPPLRPFSTLASPDPAIAQSVADQLSLVPTDDQPLSLAERLDAHFAHHLPFDLPLLRSILRLAPAAGRNALALHHWLAHHPRGLSPDDASLSHFVEHLGRAHDFKAIHELLISQRGASGPQTFAAAVDRLARAGRPTQVVRFFNNMERDYGLARDKAAMAVVVSALCENGSTGHAERFVKELADEFFPDDKMCDALIRGWCIEGKLDEARRLAAEMSRGGFELGASAYNAMLDCVCKLCRKKDPLMLEVEADKVLLEMDMKGVPRNVGTFNVLISNLCKIRDTSNAVKLFDRMSEWGCYPDSTSYLLLVKSLYQAARLGEGDEMLDGMKSAGFGEAVDKKAYYGFIKALCGIERVEHAMKVFARMKKDGCGPGVKTYQLLIQKLASHGEADRTNALFREALKKKIPVEAKVYKVNPRYVKKSKNQLKKEAKPKRETLPEKMARKRRRLRKLRLSFVKKPKKGRMRAY